MSKHSVGDLITFNENGTHHLAIVTGNNSDGTIDIHVFTTSHHHAHPSQCHPLPTDAEVKKKA